MSKQPPENMIREDNPTNFRPTPENKALIQKRKEQGITIADTLNESLDRLRAFLAVQESAPEMCKMPDGNDCPQFGNVTEKGVLCIWKKTETDPVHFRFTPFVVARFCAQKPFNTPVDKKTHQQYESKFNLMKSEIDAANRRHGIDHRKIESLKSIEKERDNTLSEIQRLNEEVILPLQNDNQFLRKAREELLHDPLAQKVKELSDQLTETKGAMAIQASNHSADMEESKQEIEKWRALLKVEKDKSTDMRFTVEKRLSDLKQFLPTVSPSCEVCSEGGFKLKEYKQSALKSIENLEGYVRTLAN